MPRYLRLRSGLLLKGMDRATAMCPQHIKKKDKSEYLIQSVAHALDMLEQFRDDVDELSVNDFRKNLHLHRRNAIKLLATLEYRNYIELNRVTDNYRLGIKTLQLSQSAVKKMKLHSQSMPILKSLTGICNETCYVGILKGTNVVYLDTVESPLPVRIVTKIGTMLPVYCTAAGKVLLASIMERDQKEAIPLPDIRQYTMNTITDTRHLIKQLETITMQGYALEDEEMDLGVRGVAAPIRDYTRRVVGALSISGPVMRFSEERMLNELVPMVKQAAGEISIRIGYDASAKG